MAGQSLVACVKRVGEGMFAVTAVAMEQKPLNSRAVTHVSR